MMNKNLLGTELQRVVTGLPLYQELVRRLRGAADTTDKTRAFRRDVLNAISASTFEAEEFASVTAYADHESLVLATLQRVDPRLGVWIELGVGSAASTRLLCATAQQVGRTMTLHGFDSFQGLPEAWGEIAPAGTYAYPRPSLSEPNVVLHEGWFADTLPLFAGGLTEQVGFLHVDCDLYSSTWTAFDALRKFIRPGTVLLFDEYWNYLEAPEHEMKALRDFVERDGLGFSYIGYNRNYMQASVVITEPGNH
jgi:methyltransferase family protein